MSPTARGIAALIAAALVVAAASLLLPWSLAFDPQAWVVWGRDALRLELDTRSGPSWKPLPVLVTTPLALTGGAAPALWLVVARAGGLLALAGAAALGARLGGRVAGAAAAAIMAFSPWWAYNTALGNSEGMLAAALLWSVVAHLAGRPRAALALGTAAALLRPEVWPFLAVYGAWLWRRDRGARVVVGAAAAVVPVLWVGPDLLGIGGAVSASNAARGFASAGSAALEDVPALAVLADAVTLLTVPATLAAIVGAVAGPRPARVLGIAAAAWAVIVAVMAQAGYAGNPRYLVASAAIGSALAGVGAARAGAALNRRTAGPAVAATAVVLAAAIVASARPARPGVRTRRARGPARGAAGAGEDRGRGDAIVGCARVRTARDAWPFVAWELDLPMLNLGAPPRKPAVVLRWRPYDEAPFEPLGDPAGDGYRLLARVPGWEAWAACG